MLRPKILAFAIAVLMVASGRLLAQADINNGTVRLGVRLDGALIINPINAPFNSVGGTTTLGLRFMPTNSDTLAFINFEGWGVADAISANWGGSAKGAQTNLAGISLISTATTAVSTVTAGGVFKVTHDFSPSTDTNLYLVKVTVQNIGVAAVNGQYRRVADLANDGSFGNQYITIQGSALPGVLSFTNQSFSVPNPLVAPTGVNGDVVNQGPGNFGATVTLDLGTLNPVASVSFNTYYGAVPTRAAAVASVIAVGAQGYTLVQPGSSLAGIPNTFIYGFIPVPPPVPGVTITESGGSTNVTEGGATDTYTVVLNTAPTANATITVNPDAQETVAPALLTFTPANWNVPQTVTVTAVNHFGTVGPHLGLITHTTASADPAYNGIAIASVTVHIVAVLIAPPPSGNGEGTHRGSNGPVGGGEGAFGFGFGLRAANPPRLPILYGPCLDPAEGRTFQVFNVSHRQTAGHVDASTDVGLPPPLVWTLLAGIALGLIALLAVKSGRGSRPPRRGP